MTLTFGPFSLTTEESRLTCDGVEVRLRRREALTLQVLIRHMGEFVHADVIMAEAWEGAHVSRHTVHVTIAELRQHLGEYAGWLVHRSKIGYALDVPGLQDMVRRGWHFWSLRTRGGYERAIECFQRAIGTSPSDSRAFDGLSASYLALGVFGMRAPLEVYPRFLEAHGQAVALGGSRPELRSNLGFGLCVFEHRPQESEAEFLRALDEKPSLGSVYVRLAMLYGSLGRFDEAFDVLRRGRRHDPLLPTLAAAEVLVCCWQRDFATAITRGRQGVDLHPYLLALRVNYAHALYFAGRLEDALAQYQIASTMSPDEPCVRALEGACHAALGRLDDARAKVRELEVLRRTQYVDAYYIAVLHIALGEPQAALEDLNRASVENSAYLYALDVNPRFDALRDDPAFRRLCRNHVTRH